MKGKNAQIGAIVIVVILIIVVGAFFLFRGINDGNESGSGSPSLAVPAPGEESGNLVTITFSGFSPSTLTVSSGETVTFLNTDSKGHWVASNIHPTHTIYPGSDIAKCGTSEESEIFDSCGSLSNGESYGFTLDEVGSWNYHDHLRPSLTGTIVVQ